MFVELLLTDSITQEMILLPVIDCIEQRNSDQVCVKFGRIIIR